MEVTTNALVLLIVAVAVSGQDQVEVTTQQGRVKGWRMQNSGYRFLGIPYAKPPVGERRFKPPEDPERYALLDAVTSRVCPQSDPFVGLGYGYYGEEDCLTLDIYTKRAPQQSPSSGNLNAVLVYLPGGKFRYGSSATFQPENIFLHSTVRDVLLVVVNYRLGVLGFLSTEDDVVPGNMGLLDQNMALHWISNNIINFGGDPQKILLFGHDSGAVSVGLHLVSRKSQGKFQRAAMLGGAIENPWAFRYQQARRHAETFASRLNCPTRNSHEMVACLREIKDVGEFIKQQNEFTNITFLPVIDKNFTQDPFLEDKPMELMRRTQAAVPMLFGMTANEGSIDFYDRLTDAQREKLPRSAMSVYLKEYLFPKTVFGDWLNPEEDRAMESIVKGVHYLYFKEMQSIEWSHTKPNWTEMISDYYYRSGIVNMARMWAQKTQQNTYLYSLEYQSAMSYGKLLSNAGSNDYGVAHMDDVFYYFNTTYRFHDTNIDNSVQALKRTFVGMLTDIADQGKIVNSLGNIRDPPSIQRNEYIRMTVDPSNKNGISVFTWPLNHIDSRMDFWTYFIPDTLNNTDNYNHVSMVPAHYASATWGLVTIVVILAIVCISLVSVIVVTRRNTKFMKVPTKSSDNVEMKGKV